MIKEIEIPNTTEQERKEQAIKYMKRLDIYKPYIRGFEQDDEVCYFERHAGFWAWQDKELMDKIREVEQKYHCTVYAVIHEYTGFGELFDMLVVTDHKEEWNDLIDDCDDFCYAFAYVWNKAHDECSEFGTICVSSFGGGLRRIG